MSALLKRIRVNTVDEMIHYLASPPEPWSVQTEVRVSGAFDSERLTAALNAAALLHPLTRARLVRRRGVGTSYCWEISERPDHVSLGLIDCPDDEALRETRARLYSFAPPLNVSPSFAATLARSADGDILMLNLNHVAGDGISALRIMRSILRSYAGVKDPVSDTDPLAVRDVRSLAGSKTLRQLVGRAGSLYRTLNTRGTTHVARTGANRAGYGFVCIELSPEETASVHDARTAHATVNDVLLGGLAVAIRRWNDLHGASRGQLRLMMPVNLRPDELRSEIVSNLTSFVVVSVPENAQTTLSAAIDAVCAQTTRLKSERASGALIDLIQPVALPIPIAIKRRTLPPALDQGHLAAVLSNLGHVDGFPDLGASGKIRELWFSPPGRMPLGVSIGAASLGGSIFLTLRYRHPQFSTAAAEEFALLYREALTGRVAEHRSEAHPRALSH